MTGINDFTDEQGWFNYQGFYDYVSSYNFETLVEIGVWKGSSISYLASKNQHSKLYAVDLFEDTYRYKKGELKKAASTISTTYNENLKKTKTRDLITDIKSLSWEAAELFTNSSVDFVFIDADHSYESVKKDINAWFSKVKPGGIFSGHDYAAYNGNDHPGVKRAVDEFAAKQGLQLRTHQGSVWYFKV
jgi:predicted O-methyltransferase YrrM